MPGESQGGFASLGADPDAAEQRIAEWAQGFAAKAQRYQAAQQATERIRLTAASSDGRVRVTVGADGNVTDLELTDKARSMPPAELSAQILATMRKAQADIAARVGQVMTEHLGDEDMQTRTVMLDNLRGRFPEQPDEPDPAVPEEPSTKWDFPGEDGDSPQAGPSQAGPSQAGPPSTPPPPESPPRKPRRRADDDYDDGDFGPDFDPLRD